jgi:hypothetical protein
MREHDKSVRLPVLVLALSVLLVSSGRCFAARYVPISVSLGGKVVMKAGSGDNGNPGPDAVWRYLKDAKLQPVRGFNIEPDRDNPLRATLKGDVVLDVAYAGRAELPELKLTRATPDAPWQIEPAEIERTFKSRHKPFGFIMSIEGTPTLWTVQRTRAGKTADDPDNLWRELKRLTIYGRKIAPDTDDPLHTTLTGGIVIELVYAGQPWGKVEVAQLKLYRDKANALWRVEPAEVDRTFKSRTRPN